jgi:hypothetical protein
MVAFPPRIAACAGRFSGFAHTMFVSGSRSSSKVRSAGKSLRRIFAASGHTAECDHTAPFIAAQEEADPDSVYNYTRRMIALRAKTPAFVYGDYKDLDPQHPQIFVYTRILGPERYLVIHNFSAQPIAYTLPNGETAGTLTIDNYTGDEANASTLHLKGWESRIYKQ